MPEISARKSENTYTRRAFIQAVLAAPLALGATALVPEEAEAATKVMKVGPAVLRVPSIWKKRLIITGRGHTSGVVVGEFKYRPYANFPYESQCPVIYYGYNAYEKGGAGRRRIKYKGDLMWDVSKGNKSITLQAFNVPLTIWECAHGQGYYSITEKQAKELLKISTGGRIKYATLIKWSKAKAKSKGAKAVRAWVGAKVIKKVKIR